MKRISVFSASIRGRFGAGRENYGDNLMALLLPALFNLEPSYVEPERAELIGAGSILDAYHRKISKKIIRGMLPLTKRRPWRTLHIWGSGFMNTDGLLLWPQSIHVHAVRGPLSLEKIFEENIATQNVALGDPAILLPVLKPKHGPLRNAVAVVPHFATYPQFLSRFGSTIPPHWKIIDLTDNPEKVTDEISSAEWVISSSLHGLIVADAYGIPSRRMVGTGIKGDGFKYRDYEAFRGSKYSVSIGFEECLRVRDRVHDLMDPPSPPSEEIVRRLIASFPQ